MFCSNCGKKIPDVAKFCPECGSKVDAPAAPAPKAPEAPAAPVTPEVKAAVAAAPAVSAAKKKFKMPDFKAILSSVKTMDRKKLIAIGVAAVLAVLLIVFNITALANTAMKVVMSDEDYYQYVEMKAMKKAIGVIGDKYGEYLEITGADTIGTHMVLSLAVGDEMRGYMESYTGEDFSWLKDIRLDVSAGGNKNQSDSEAKITVNSEELANAYAYADMTTGTLYFNMPQLSSVMAKMPMTEFMSDYEYAEMQKTMALMYQAYEKCPDKAAFEKILVRYVTAVLEGVNEVDKDSGKLSAGGVSGKYTVLEVEVTEKTMQKVVMNVLTEFKTDKEVKKLIIDIAPLVNPSVDGNLVYSELMSEVDYYIDELRDADITYDDELFTMEVFVNAKGDIVGRRIMMDGEIFVLVAPEDGKDVGLEISYSDGYDRIALIGKGTKDGNMLNGVYEATLNGSKFVTVNVGAFDWKRFEEGDIYGSFTVDIAGADHTLLSDMVDVDTSMLTLASNYKLRLISHPTEEIPVSLNLDVVNSSNETVVGVFGSITYNTNIDYKWTADTNSAINVEEWAYSVDAQGFMEHIFKIIPESALYALGSMDFSLGAMDFSNGADDYYYDAPAEAWPEEDW